MIGRPWEESQARKTDEICWNEEEKEENKKTRNERKEGQAQARLLHDMTSREIQTSMAAHMANITFSACEVLQY